MILSPRLVPLTRRDGRHAAMKGLGKPGAGGDHRRGNVRRLYAKALGIEVAE